LTAGKSLAFRLGRPFTGINHTEGHIYSTFLGPDAPAIEATCPYVALVVSGGHTCLVRVEALGRYVMLGQTIDDAAGEAFDKGANLLRLGFPGGPAIEKASIGGKTDHVRFPRGRQKRADRLPLEGLDPDLCFSFSGLKTSLLHYVGSHPEPRSPGETSSIASSYQEAIVDALVERCAKAIRDERFISAVGGVSLNKRLRERLGELARSLGIGFLPAEPRYCADNAAMIAGLAGRGRGVRGPDAMALDISPSLGLACNR
jgi:N6-L-threonylcarbamoyladenine synthase